jgi:proteic killer suppression protein
MLFDVIAGFRDRQTELVWGGEFSRKLPPDIQEAALTKLRLLNAAVRLENLSAVPGNRLESLNGERRGQHSIRINRQWRICFRWEGGNAHAVEIVDYH